MAAQVQALIAQAPGALRDFRVGHVSHFDMLSARAHANCNSIKDFQQTRLSALRPPQEFFDVQRVSRPQDLNEATRRISHNTRYFGGNYSLVGGCILLSVPAFTLFVWILARLFLARGHVGLASDLRAGHVFIVPRSRLTYAFTHLLSRTTRSIRPLDESSPPHRHRLPVWRFHRHQQVRCGHPPYPPMCAQNHSLY